MKLLKFQRTFITNAIRPEVKTAALSIPRGNGKSTLAGHLVARALTPDDALFHRGTESIIVASSLEQGRIVYKAARDIMRENLGLDQLDDDIKVNASDLGPDYSCSDSLTRIRIVHKSSKTAVQVRGANARGLMGLVKCPWVICDEPGSWKPIDGLLMWDAIDTAHGKPESVMTVILIGTIAPTMTGWWPELLERGSRGSRYVQSLQGNRERWDDLQHVHTVNPLLAKFPEGRAQLREERDEARNDTRLKARFLSYRLNVPTADESEVLLTVEDFKLATARDVAPPTGQPIVGVDLGQNRSWTAAVAIWETGRIEAMAIAPGIPDLAEQEKRDTVPRGTYQKLHDMGVLDVADGLRVPEPTHLWEDIKARWGVPAAIVCDRFRLPLLQDAVQGACYIDPRITRWSDAVFDIRSLQKGFKDGPFSVEESSRPLLIASLAAAFVKNDDQGNTRLSKRNSDQKARDDVAAALTLAAGGWGRATLGRREAPADETEVFIAR